MSVGFSQLSVVSIYIFLLLENYKNKIVTSYALGLTSRASIIASPQPQWIYKSLCLLQGNEQYFQPPPILRSKQPLSLTMAFASRILRDDRLKVWSHRGCDGASGHYPIYDGGW